ncbi:hypothetical protein QJS10_CPB15g01833 [Acorus calamus]|uniref:Uncharacterized protein n=1 Tax=Acorus calamus TaxID=4465 RepID=A0AAV9D9D3_ACOCL|nr:hypothetical protein QJS10_CPB15g01833 [Acorus calamus]
MKRNHNMSIKLRRVACRGTGGATSRRRGRPQSPDSWRELRMLVPGGRRLRLEDLLSRTEDYIFFLRMKVRVLMVSALWVHAARIRLLGFKPNDDS